MPRRISLDYAAFNKYKKAWSHNIPLTSEQLYEALVVSVMMYNSSCQCWTAPKSVLEKLDVVHRHHLRSILNYRYPNIISNMNLFKRCNAEPLSVRVVSDRSRWRMLGHVLRGPIDGPAYSSLVFAAKTLQYQGRLGRPQSNLFSLILLDLNVHCPRCSVGGCTVFCLWVPESVAVREVSAEFIHMMRGHDEDILLQHEEAFEIF